MTNTVLDLHCDMLAFLAENSTHTPYDPQVRCSIPQLKAGGVTTQVMAAFTPGGERPQEFGSEQVEIFQRLLADHSDVFCTAATPNNNKIGILLAIENASALCGEEEPLKQGIQRLRDWQRCAGPIAYVSLTWNPENRFGGGADSDAGLKSDGKQLLDVLTDLSIPIDLSHASDALARDILQYLEGKDLPAIASHSNCRTICDVPRNLPEDVAQAIIDRGGVIGITVVKRFVGDTPERLVQHVEKLLKMGGERNIALGADFFYDASLPEKYRPPGGASFFSDYGDASCYPRILDMLRKILSEEQIANITHRNAARVLLND